MSFSRFKAEEIERLVNSISGMTISPEQVHDIFSKTGGNPLFVIEIGKHLFRQRHQHLQGDHVLDSLPIPVPSTIRVALRQRFDVLSQTCRKFLRIAAVMGREFEFGMACQLLPNASEETLRAGLEEALDAGIIEDAPELDRYRFHHILMQQVVYESISKARRLWLHDQVGLCMETAYTEGSDIRVDQLLYHFEASGAMANAARVAHYANLFQLDWRNGLEKCLRAIDLAPVLQDDYTEASAHGWAARCHWTSASK